MARVSDAVKTILAKKNIKITELAAHWGTSRASVSNKVYRDYWSADELADLARYTGSQLLYRFPDGTEIQVMTDTVPHAKP